MSETENGLIPKVKLIGIGDFGCKILNYIATKRYRNLELVAINTDVQSLLNSQAHRRISNWGSTHAWIWYTRGS